MTDKVQKIREDVEKLKSQLLRGACSSQVAMETMCKEEAYNEVLAILDSTQEELKAKFKVGQDIVPKNRQESFLTITAIKDGHYYSGDLDICPIEEQDQWELAEEPTKKDYHERYKRIAQSERFKKSYAGMSIGEVIPIEGEDSANIDFEKELYKQFGQVKDFTLCMQIAKRFYDMGKNSQEPLNGLNNNDMPIERWKQAVVAASNQRNYRSSKGLTETRDDYFVDGVQWADEHPKEEPVSEDLGEYINELSKQFPEVSFAKLSRIAVRVSKWQKEKD